MFDVFFEGFSWLLSAFYSLIPNYGIAIALVTFTVYLALFPVTLKQTRSMLAMSRLQPEIARLKKEHRGDQRKLMEAQQELFQREGVNPAASCLPTLLQMPVYIILWQVLSGLTRRTAEGTPDPKYLEEGSRLYRDIVADGGELLSFGVDLAKTALKGPHASFTAALPFFVLAAIAGVTQYVQIKRSQGRNPRAGDGPPGMQVMMRIFPVMTVFSSLIFPAGLAVYFVVSNLFRIAQQEAMYRFDPHVIHHAKEAAKQVETTAVDVKKREKASSEARESLKPAKTTSSRDSRSNGSSDPPPYGRAQPKGTRTNRSRKKKSRR
jgi:YidC/Oxa1 family membrane protein insertase